MFLSSKTKLIRTTGLEKFDDPRGNASRGNTWKLRFTACFEFPDRYFKFSFKLFTRFTPCYFMFFQYVRQFSKETTFVPRKQGCGKGRRDFRPVEGGIKEQVRGEVCRIEGYSTSHHDEKSTAYTWWKLRLQLVAACCCATSTLPGRRRQKNTVIRRERMKIGLR